MHFKHGHSVSGFDNILYLNYHTLDILYVYQTVIALYLSQCMCNVCRMSLHFDNMLYLKYHVLDIRLVYQIFIARCSPNLLVM